LNARQFEPRTGDDPRPRQIALAGCRCADLHRGRNASFLTDTLGGTMFPTAIAEGISTTPDGTIDADSDSASSPRHDPPRQDWQDTLEKMVKCGAVAPMFQSSCLKRRSEFFSLSMFAFGPEKASDTDRRGRNMGLDLLAMGCAKPGQEAEWEKLMATLYNGGEESEEAAARRLQISVAAYETVGAPQVGKDPEADAWMLAGKGPESPLSDAEFLEMNKGYYVLDLVENCDGVPRYSHGGLYEGVDGTSFRGAFLADCTRLLAPALLSRAWEDVLSPADAIDYSRKLLACAESDSLIEPEEPPAPKKRGLWSRVFGRRQAEPPVRDATDIPLEEQRAILRAAGRWYRFWGERGHPIRAHY
jgi:hypothetical protein